MVRGQLSLVSCQLHCLITVNPKEQLTTNQGQWTTDN